MYQDQIKKILHEITGEKGVVVEVPIIAEHGDYSSNIAMVLAKKEKKNTRKLAEEIVRKIESNHSTMQPFDRISVAGPGFINFYLRKDILVSGLMHIDANYGKSDKGKGKTVVIDYSSPNIAKPFGIGHLRSTIIGQALYNLYEFLGYKVIGDNHLGDWGTQFGKLLYMIDREKPKSLSIETLEKLYVKFHELEQDDSSLAAAARSWFKQLEKGDRKAREIWQKCVDVSMEEFEKIYKLLGVKIDFAYGESFYEDIMKKMLETDSISRHLSAGKDGKSKILNLEKYGIKTPLMFLKSDGATTYATRDLATIKFRVDKWNPDIFIYEVGSEQSLYFKQLFAAAKLLGLVGDDVEMVHTGHGLYLAPDGKKFSTRKGKTIKLEEALSEAIQKAKDLGSKDEETAKKVGIGAIKYFDLAHSVSSDVVFDWKKILNLEGNSGPYIQYTVARINSVLAKAKKQTKNTKINAQNLEISREEKLLLHTLIHYPEVIKNSAKSYSPNLLCNYLYKLASAFNSFYNAHKIIGGENEEFKLLLTEKTAIVLKSGLGLIGIQAPERM